jgi:hypothetical protein
LRRILLAYTVNEFGTWFAYVALSVVVYDHTHSALAVSAMFISTRFVPALLVPALVVRLEASQRRGLMPGLYAFEALAAGLLILVVYHFWLPGILILVAVDGAAALTAAALLRAAAARVAAEEAEIPPGASEATQGEVEVAQRGANAALNIAYTVTVAVGPATAGVIVATAGATTALLIDACSFLICGALLMDLYTHVDEASGASVRARLRAAWHHLRAMPALRNLLITEAIAVIFFASVEPIEVIYAKQTLQVGDRGFGLLLGVWGAGMVLGGLIFTRSLRRPLGPMLTVGTLLVGVAYMGSAAAPDLAIACCAAFIGGIGNGVQWASLISAVQRLTPQMLLGRLMSAVEAIGALCPAIGFLLGGAITALSSPRVALLVAGLVATAATSVFYRTTMHAGALTLPSVRPAAADTTGVASESH